MFTKTDFTKDLGNRKFIYESWEFACMKHSVYSSQKL